MRFCQVANYNPSLLVLFFSSLLLYIPNLSPLAFAMSSFFLFFFYFLDPLNNIWELICIYVITTLNFTKNDDIA